MCSAISQHRHCDEKDWPCATEVIMTSPLTRALETTKLSIACINPTMRPVIHEGLRERLDDKAKNKRWVDYTRPCVTEYLQDSPSSAIRDGHPQIFMLAGSEAELLLAVDKYEGLHQKSRTLLSAGVPKYGA